MGTMTMLQQDATRRKEKSMETIKKEVEKLEKKLEKKESLKQAEKDYKIALKNDLYMFFYSHFEKMLKDNFPLEQIYNNLLILKNRNEVIKNYGENSLEYDFLNEIYKKELKKVYSIYLDSQKSTEELQPKITYWDMLKEQKQQEELYIKKQIGEARDNRNFTIMIISFVASFLLLIASLFDTVIIAIVLIMYCILLFLIECSYVTIINNIKNKFDKSGDFISKKKIQKYGVIKLLNSILK